MLIVSLILGLVGGATIIVLLTGDDPEELATRSDSSTDERSRSSSSTAPAPAEADADSSSSSGDEGTQVTLGDRTASTAISGSLPGVSAPVATTVPSPGITSPSTSLNSGFPAGSGMEGKYVAVVWSEKRSAASDPQISAKVAEYRARYGDGVFGLHDGAFPSLKEGTVAVALDNDFTSARQAAQWCLNEGLSGRFTCFGVVLNDSPYVKDESGDYRRMYPERLS